MFRRGIRRLALMAAVVSLVAAALPATAGAFSPGGTTRVVKNTVYTGYAYYTGPRFRCTNSSKTVTSNCSYSFSYSVANGFNANVSVTGGAVSSGVGFSVTATYAEIKTAGTSVPPNRCMIVGLNYRYKTYSFDVYDYTYSTTGQLISTKKVGTGTAKRYDMSYAIADGPFSISYCLS